MSHPNGSQPDLRFAFELADLAGTIAMERFRASDLAVAVKDDGSPVTDADKDIECALRERIAASRPGHAIIGEEFGETGNSEWRWYLDPIDGTTDFVAGRRGWTTLIALTFGDDVRLAVVGAPAQDTRWWAVKGEGAFRDGAQLAVSSTARLGDATVSDDWLNTLASGISDTPLARLAAGAGRVLPHQGHSLLTVAAGLTDLAVGPVGFAWDYAPVKLITEEAGGRFTDLCGRPRFDSGNALVSNGLLHDQALGLLGVI